MNNFEAKKESWNKFLEKFEEQVKSYNYYKKHGSEVEAIAAYNLMSGMGSSIYYLFGIERNVSMRESDGLVTKVVFKNENKVIAEIIL